MSPQEYLRQCYQQGVPVREIAQTLGISRDAVKNRAARDPLCPPHKGFLDIQRPLSDNDIIVADSTNQGVQTMAEPSKADMDALLLECEKYGIDVNDVKHFWHKSKKISMFVVAQNRPTYETVRDEMMAAMQRHAPKYPKIQRKKLTDGHLLVIDPADIHIGKLAVKEETGYTYNSELAVKMVHEGVTGLLQKASGYPVERIMLVVGNDVLHRDTPHNTTTSGTRQDVDGMWHQSFVMARTMYVDVIERLVQYAPVDVVFNPSNHDYASGFMLTDSLASWFRNAKDVTFDATIKHRKYYIYGKNLIATTHGDGAKMMDMPLLMASEAPELWGQTRHRYIYQHHLHHKTRVNWQSAKDHPGITLEILRSPSAPDGWHDRNGYTGAPQAIEGFIHHPYNGRVACLTHTFDTSKI